MEDYFCKLPSNLAQQLCWFRAANHKLPAETGRWAKIDNELREWDLCISNKVGGGFNATSNVLHFPVCKASRGASRYLVISIVIHLFISFKV